MSNESYTRCLAELRARYGTRGVGVSVRKDAVEQVKKEEQTKSSSNYYLFDSRSGIASSYKSGEYNGSKYMTSDDFVRYFRSRRPYATPVQSKSETALEAKKADHPATRRKSAREGSSDSKEGHLITRAVSYLNELKEKWLPVEIKEGRTTGKRFKFPVAATAYVLTFAFSMGLIVSGSVMIGNASGELGEMNTQIAVLEARESELQSELDLKCDIATIKADAEALGMISGEYAGGKTLLNDTDEEIEVYEQEEEKNIFAVLLSAIGIDVK